MRYPYVLISALIVGILALSGAFVPSASPATTPLSRDLLLHWSATQLFLAGQNYYDYELLKSVERTFGAFTTGPAYCSPLTIVALLPVWAWPFSVAIALTLFVNLTALFLCTELSLARYRWKPSPPVVALIGISFLPALDAINFAQTSILTTLAIYAAARCFDNRRDGCAGACFSLALVKFHLAYLLLPLAALWAFKEKRWYFFSGFLLMTGALALVAVMVSPHSFTSWLSSGGNDPLRWQAVSIVTPLRMLSPHVYLWPVFVVPLTAVFATLLWGLRTRNRSLESALPVLTAFTVFTLPYGFIFDHALYLALYAGLIGRAMNETTKLRSFIAISLLSYQALMIALHLGGVVDFRLFWAPLPLIALYLMTGRMTTRADSTNGGLLH